MEKRSGDSSFSAGQSAGAVGAPAMGNRGSNAKGLIVEQIIKLFMCNPPIPTLSFQTQNVSLIAKVDPGVHAEFTMQSKRFLNKKAVSLTTHLANNALESTYHIDNHGIPPFWLFLEPVPICFGF